ncbi:MAG: hypothetical protein CL678_17760 [Bdellovibrionaceae bacterium]|nr:hypothetical protein [Pseudobdellovibrionaceae bacterium]|tara:strand:- start:3777 stop:4388 length:612 start_codon:yes stop_codon:yes gene_type:complete
MNIQKSFLLGTALLISACGSGNVASFTQGSGSGTVVTSEQDCINQSGEVISIGGVDTCRIIKTVTPYFSPYLPRLNPNQGGNAIDSGIDVEKGDLLKVSLSGTWAYCDTPSCNNTRNFNGYHYGTSSTVYYQSKPVGLLGMTSSQVFYTGQSYNNYFVESGRYRYGINYDGNYFSAILKSLNVSQFEIHQCRDFNNTVKLCPK